MSNPTISLPPAALLGGIKPNALCSPSLLVRGAGHSGNLMQLRHLTDEDYKAMDEAEESVLNYYEKHGTYPND